MNIFIRELKANRRALIIWCVCMALGVVAGMAKYTAFSGGAAGSEVFTHLPRTLRALFGMSDFDVAKIGGYFAFLFFYIELAAAAHASLLGAVVVSKEERDHTSEFLGVKPVSRQTVLTAKLAAAAVDTLLLNVVTLGASLAAVSQFSGGKRIFGEVFWFFLSLLFVQLIFLSLGALIASAARKPAAAASFSAFVMLASFLIAELTNFTDRLDALNVLSPFKYFSFSQMAGGKAPGALPCVLSAALIAAFITGAYLCYRARDVKP